MCLSNFPHGFTTSWPAEPPTSMTSHTCVERSSLTAFVSVASWPSFSSQIMWYPYLQVAQSSSPMEKSHTDTKKTFFYLVLVLSHVLIPFRSSAHNICLDQWILNFIWNWHQLVYWLMNLKSLMLYLTWKTSTTAVQITAKLSYQKEKWLKWGFL